DRIGVAEQIGDIGQTKLIPATFEHDPADIYVLLSITDILIGHIGPDGEQASVGILKLAFYSFVAHPLQIGGGNDASGLIYGIIDVVPNVRIYSCRLKM